ncbi:MAG TPA: hypothetical protein VIH12_02345 [Solibacillus sp.]
MNKAGRKAGLYNFYKNNFYIMTGTVKEIAIATGLSATKIRTQTKKPAWTIVVVRLGDNEFSLYEGDKYIFTGSKKEIAEHLNVAESTITYYAGPAYIERIEKQKDKYYLEEVE